jgi:hypothetical protein
MTGAITVPAGLVQYLRRGLLFNLGLAAEQLSFLSMRAKVGDGDYRMALQALDVARLLLDKIGVSESGAQGDIEVDRAEDLVLVFKILKSQHLTQVQRLQDAAAEGLALPSDSIQALGMLVVALEERLDRSVHHGRVRARRCPSAGLDRHCARRTPSTQSSRPRR